MTKAPRETDTDFRARLRGELLRRCAANSKYSLRAFARDLRIDHSTLSQLLRGRRALTTRTIRRLGERLRLESAQIDRFAARASRPAAEPMALRLARDWTADAARALEEWPHLAILELTRLDGFRPDSRFIARVLGTSVDEVNVALQRLLRLGLLEMLRPDGWIDKTAGAANGDAFARATLRRLLTRLRALVEP